MGKMYFLLGGQYSEFLLEKMRADAMFEAVQRDKYPIKYLKIIDKL